MFEQHDTPIKTIALKSYTLQEGLYSVDLLDKVIPDVQKALSSPAFKQFLAFYSSPKDSIALSITKFGEPSFVELSLDQKIRILTDVILNANAVNLLYNFKDKKSLTYLISSWREVAGMNYLP